MDWLKLMMCISQEKSGAFRGLHFEKLPYHRVPEACKSFGLFTGDRLFAGTVPELSQRDEGCE